MTLFLKILLSFDGRVMYASYIVLLSSSLSTLLEEMRKIVKIHHLIRALITRIISPNFSPIFITYHKIERKWKP
jgi:hypothetical protein